MSEKQNARLYLDNAVTPLLRPLLLKAVAERPTDLPRWLAEQALALKEAQDEEGKAYCKARHLEIEVKKKLKEEVAKLEAAPKRRRGAADTPLA